MEEFVSRVSQGNWIINYQLSGKVAYGTNIDEIKEKGEAGLICLHIIYPSSDGAGKMREVFGERLYSIGIYVRHEERSKHFEETQKRLMKRGRDGIEIIEARLKHQSQILDYIWENPKIESVDGYHHVFDRLLTYVDLDKTFNDVLHLFQKVFLE
jgi:guanylate kinase